MTLNKIRYRFLEVSDIDTLFLLFQEKYKKILLTLVNEFDRYQLHDPIFHQIQCDLFQAMQSKR